MNLITHEKCEGWEGISSGVVWRDLLWLPATTAETWATDGVSKKPYCTVNAHKAYAEPFKIQLS